MSVVLTCEHKSSDKHILESGFRRACLCMRNNSVCTVADVCVRRGNYLRWVDLCRGLWRLFLLEVWCTLSSKGCQSPVHPPAS